jgi:hypothetical protein
MGTRRARVIVGMGCPGKQRHRGQERNGVEQGSDGVDIRQLQGKGFQPDAGKEFTSLLASLEACSSRGSTVVMEPGPCGWQVLGYT